MRYHELVRRVQEVAGLDSREEAEQAVQATLSSLGECLYRTERRHLASQLPKEAKAFVYEGVDSGVTRQAAACLTLQEFYDRVGARANVTRTHAIERAKAVTEVLQEVLPEGEWKHIVREMPQEYGALLGEQSAGPEIVSA
ncbi:MAG: DUF2267 domain-containing protein [Anaerolineae bacterium]|nr:DUF2267 domain-containing protein [Anaerolineae bacterium]